LLADYAWEAKDNSLQRIVLNIDQVLKRGGVALQDIDGLAVASGLVRGREPKSVSRWPRPWLMSLANHLRSDFARGIGPSEPKHVRPTLPAVDAGKESVYAAFYRSREKGLVRKGDFYVGDIKGLAAAVKEPTLFLASRLTSTARSCPRSWFLWPVSAAQPTRRAGASSPG